GLEEGLFPHENSLLDQGGLEEERRLMYVAITRARRRLTLTLAQSRMLHGQTRYGMRSRFLDEIPEEHLKWITPRQRQAAARPPWSGAFRRGLGDWQGEAGSSFAPRSPRTQSAGVTVGEQCFRIGTGVRHGRFGEGTVVALSGSGADAQARIEFRDAGTKTLALGGSNPEVLVAAGPDPVQPDRVVSASPRPAPMQRLRGGVQQETQCADQHDHGHQFGIGQAVAGVQDEIAQA